ncbi:MAG: efflux RND transporter periplasmic adaptor subunit [Verrucomicrobia bacterium]|nr:efflux RND transporter periplasmic adaptor subunit [Verrucomicrobiota bacterium]
MPATTTPTANKPGELKQPPPVRRRLRAGLKLLVAAALAGVLVYKLKFSPAPVVSHLIARGPVVAEVMGTGTLEARVKTTISPRIQERLAEMLVDQGEPVSAGQLLARLDDGELKRQAEVSDAALASAKATADRVRVDEARAQAVEQQARQDHKRISDLLATKVSSQAEMDKAIAQWRVAETDLQRARAATVEAQQQIITAEKNLAYQRERLGFTRILSPYDGLVTRRDRDPGGVVIPGSSLLQLIATNELWISAWVDETASAGLALGQVARVVFRSEPAKHYPGEVARLARETDRETREFIVDVSVKELPPTWTVGQRAEVYLETARKSSALLLPKQFLVWRSGKPGVFVAASGKARWKEIKLGLEGEERVEMLEGLKEGDKVVRPAEGRRGVFKDGQRIKES